MTCSTQYTQDVSGCVTDLLFNIDGINAANDWNVKFTFQSGMSIIKPITFDQPYYGGSSQFTISNDNYWHVGTGPVVFEFFQVGDNCAPFTFTHCTATYNAIVLNFTNIQTENDYVGVPCDCAE